MHEDGIEPPTDPDLLASRLGLERRSISRVATIAVGLSKNSELHQEPFHEGAEGWNIIPATLGRIK